MVTAAAAPNAFVALSISAWLSAGTPPPRRKITGVTVTAAAPALLRAIHQHIAIGSDDGPRR